MTRTITDRPSDAEVIATACRRARTAMLAIEPAGRFGPAGVDAEPVDLVHLFETQAFVLVPTDGAAMVQAARPGARLPTMVEITDCAPIDLREPVRSLIWLNGTLHSVPAHLERELAMEIADEHPDGGLLDIGHGRSLLRLHIEAAVIAGGSGAALVSAAELAEAVPDPFWEYESGWIAHLDADHSEVVGRMARRLPGQARDGHVRPLGLDRFGIRLRVEGCDGDSDVRLPFARPVTDPVELSHALRHLVGCPFLNTFPY